MDIAELGIRIDSTGATQAVANLDKVAASAARADTATEKLSTTATGKMVPALTGVGKASVLTGNSARMLSQQLSQVGQQTMATGNFVQALAIQLPDIGVGFGAAGAAAGLLAGIALPMLINAFASTESAAEEYAARLEALTDALDSYKSAIEAASLTSEEMIDTYGRLADTAREALTAMVAAEQFAAIQALNAELTLLANSFERASGLWKSDGVLPSGFADSLNMSADAAGRLLTLLDQVAQQQRFGGLDDQARAAAAVSDHLMAAYGTYSKMPAAAQALYNQVNATVAKAAELSSKVDDGNRSFMDMVIAAVNTTKAMADLVAAAPGSGWLSGAIADASTLAERLWDAASAAAAAQGSGGVDSRGQGTEFGPGSRARSAPRRATFEAYENSVFGVKTSGGGGGGGKQDEYKTSLESLVESLQTEQETLDAWYAEGQTILADRRAMEILGEEEHKAAKLALEQDYQAQLREIQDQGYEMERAARNAALSEAESLLNLFAGKSKTAAIAAIALNKGLRIAEIVQNTAAASMRALAELGPIAGPPMAAKIAMWGKVQAGIVAATGLAQAASAGGGSFGGSSGSTAAQGTASGETSAPQTRLIIQGLRRDDLYSGEMLMEMLGKEFQARGIEFIR